MMSATEGSEKEPRALLSYDGLDMIHFLTFDLGVGNNILSFMRVGDIQVLMCISEPIRDWITRRGEDRLIPFDGNRCRCGWSDARGRLNRRVAPSGANTRRIRKRATTRATP